MSGLAGPCADCEWSLSLHLELQRLGRIAEFVNLAADVLHIEDTDLAGLSRLHAHGHVVGSGEQDGLAEEGIVLLVAPREGVTNCRCAACRDLELVTVEGVSRQDI